MRDVQKNLLNILAGVLWGKPSQYAYSESEWEDILSLAEDQGVLTLILQGCKSIRLQISAPNWMKWRSKLISTILNNESLMAVQSDILNQMRAEGIPCAVLKGASIAACYEKSLTRALGDIDILVPKEYVAPASDVLIRHGFRAPEKSYKHPYHIDFYKKNAVVELHYAVSTYPDCDTGAEAARFMETCWNGIHWKQSGDHAVPCLGDAHQAMSLLLHMERHMTTGCIGLRQFCDWAVFVGRVQPDSFSGEILPVLERCGLAKFAGILTAAAVDVLGLAPEHAAWCGAVSSSNTGAMMDEIFRVGNIHKKNTTEDGSSFFVEESGNKAAVCVYVGKINALAKRKYPVAEKLPVLLPLFWVYIPLRYWIRSLAGKRSRKSLLRTIRMTKQRKQLYRELQLFQTDRKQLD